MKIKDLPKTEGHRKRLREKFLQGGLDGFLDYEIVELLLTLGTPRRDCKGVAKTAIEKKLSFVLLRDSNPIFQYNIFSSVRPRPSKPALWCDDHLIEIAIQIGCPP